MRGITLPQFGDPEVMKLAETPTPSPAAGEVLLRIYAAGVNRADLLQREGHYPPPAGASEILGLEVSGEIVALGPGVHEWTVGDKVCALLAGGGYAEYCVAPEGSCLRIPEGVSITEAAALPEAVFTVWANLFDTNLLHAGETFFVQGGGSGIGSTAIQMAAAFGCRIATTAGSKQKADSCLSLGAGKAFNYKEEDWQQGLLDWTGGNGVDVILDMIGGDYFPKHLKALAQRGRIAHLAYSKGREVTADLALIMQKRLVITGSTLRPRSIQEKAALRDAIYKYIWPQIERKKIRPIVDTVFPLEQAAKAHLRMQASEHIGKILLSME